MAILIRIPAKQHFSTPYQKRARQAIGLSVGFGLPAIAKAKKPTAKARRHPDTTMTKLTYVL